MSQGLRSSLLWPCLLLVFTAVPIAATPEEGIILLNWARNGSLASNVTASWGIPTTDPCAINADWYGVSCAGSNNVKILDLTGIVVFGPLPEEFGNLSALENVVLPGSVIFGPIPASFGRLTKLRQVNLGTNVLSGGVPHALWNLPNLTRLTLSGNRLGGSIQFSDGLAKKLEYVDLSSNNFTGLYPEALANFPFLTLISLESNDITGDLNVSRILELLSTTGAAHGFFSSYQAVNLLNNNIKNVILTGVRSQILSSISIKLQGNPYCNVSTDLYNDLQRCVCQQGFFCSLPNYPKYSAPGAGSSTSLSRGIIIGVSCGIFLVLVVSMGVIVKRLARRKSRELEKEYKQKFLELEVNPRPFLYKELRSATLEFNESSKLGKGAFGSVYKGVLSNGDKVAIKRLEPKLDAQGDFDDFLTEVVFITKMKHPNLVNLKGYCVRIKERMLVYEYVENMDLEKCLLMGICKDAMTWSVRFNICLGVAQGLHYLHEIARPRVIHRDIKASNILLGAQYEPKIGDFGLALLFPNNETHISLVTVAGTKGYLAPEYASFGQLSEKADVYSYGVLCLEIVSGRKNIDQSKPPNQVYLATWAWSLYEKSTLEHLIDPSLSLNDGEVQKALRVINIALLCLQQFPKRRPSMHDVQKTLEGNMKLRKPERLYTEEIVSLDSIVDESTLLSSTPQGT